jgi:hypothetical protein
VPADPRGYRWECRRIHRPERARFPRTRRIGAAAKGCRRDNRYSLLKKSDGQGRGYPPSAQRRRKACAAETGGIEMDYREPLIGQLREMPRLGQSHIQADTSAGGNRRRRQAWQIAAGAAAQAQQAGGHKQSNKKQRPDPRPRRCFLFNTADHQSTTLKVRLTLASPDSSSAA